MMIAIREAHGELSFFVARAARASARASRDGLRVGVDLPGLDAVAEAGEPRRGHRISSARRICRTL